MNEPMYNALIDSRERGERLRRIRNLANLSRKHLCEQTGININTYIGYEVGKYGGIPKKNAQLIVQHLMACGVCCSLEWLMQGVGKGPYIVADISHLSIDGLTEEQMIQTELALFRSHYANTVDLQIMDDGMVPIYELGSCVAGIACSGAEIEALIGFNCIVQIQTQVPIVRNVRKGRHKDTYILVCINPHTVIDIPVLYDVRLTFAAKILWHRQASG